MTPIIGRSSFTSSITPLDTLYSSPSIFTQVHLNQMSGIYVTHTVILALTFKYLYALDTTNSNSSLMSSFDKTDPTIIQK